MLINLNEEETDVFVEICREAPDWEGIPRIDITGRVHEIRTLSDKNIIDIENDDDDPSHVYVSFTWLGLKLAKKNMQLTPGDLGINI